ncbi:MAG: isoamylase early set domain-containing protein [Chitinophagaceae bacterium]
MGQKINFIVSSDIASGATGGVIVGDFNNWNENEAIPLKAQKDGSLKASVVLDEGRTYQYRYLLSDGRWVNDSNAHSYSFDPIFNVENCVIFVDEKKKPAAKKETVAKKDTVAKTKTTSSPAKTTTKVAKKETEVITETVKANPVKKSAAKKK